MQDPHSTKKSSPLGVRGYFLRRPLNRSEGLLDKEEEHPSNHPRCHCEQLISAVLFYCHCSFQKNKPTVFSLLSMVSESAKRWWSQKKKSFFDVSTQSWLWTWWGRVPRQVSPRGSNWLSAQRSQMLIDLQVWRMFLSNLKGSTDILRSVQEQSLQSTTICWLRRLK